MTSRRIEDAHISLLDKLLSDTGLECIRSAPESLESSSASEESEEQGTHVEEEEALSEEVIEEEIKKQGHEEIQEEQPEIFPTPSLRRILPDRQRKIEEENTIHVLPEEFKTDIDPLTIPKINYTAQQKYIDILGEIVGCTKYKSSLAEFWFLDTLANLLRRAQEDELERSTQAILILWFCEWMKEIQHFDAADRQRMLRRFKLKAKEVRDLEIQEELDREAWNRRSHILPLNFAANDQFFNKYWPPPPPEPEPKPEPESKPKGKGKK